ncbi:MAG: phosphatidylserine decarboxylase family protein [Haliscomenobacteraceae bacterium CHB4]|nr:Phosphatidylserine decarboxylase proenzyme [Saprospiraceae bacterium]MCE7924030.1 phosphatidylserine decarboxylase family protein [Haliscomenobacteraceae bacterium CHB4]
MLFRIHKEGRTILLVAALVLVGLNLAVWNLAQMIFWPVLILSTIFYLVILQFFRNPARVILLADNKIVYAPADGKVCAIEEVFEAEYFKDKRLQVSIFMSPFNVHVNRNPVSGMVNYFRYHPGKYLVAWHPKSSTENERTTIVYDSGNGEILMRQIAGALAKRIKWYIREGERVEQGCDMGFIKFGSRVDLFLPLDAKIEVAMDQQVKGNKTVVARL